jgi:hypothetical protein
MKTILPKFKFKTDPVVLNAPLELTKEFIDLGCNTSFDKKIKSQATLAFINDKKEFIQFLKTQLKNIEPDSVLWFAYPKQTSGIKTDINRDKLWEFAQEYGIRPVSAISINDTWSGLRFRPIDKVK